MTLPKKRPGLSFKVNKKTQNYSLGLRAELSAGSFLIDQGIQLIAWRSRTRTSEVDWIGVGNEEGKTVLYFFEVRVRTLGKTFFSEALALESFTSKKFYKIKSHVGYFRACHPEYSQMEVRMELIVYGPQGFMRIPHPFWSDY